jgi:phosphatidate cytidylyltransferase
MPSVEVLALATCGLLAFGSAVLGLFALIPATAKTAREAFPILLTEILIVGSAVAALWLGGWVLWIALALLTARVLYEVTQVSGLAPRLLLFPGVPLVIFVLAGLSGGFGAWLLLAFLFVETFDSYALLGGRLFGRTKAFPVLSPNKTVEGLGAGLVMLMATAALGAWALDAPLLPALGLAVLTVPLAITGDLAASRLKRRAGVKDYPTILPRQGGLFDITDAWITTGAGFVLVALVAAL